MRIGEKLNEGFTFASKKLWIILVPILLDMINLFLYQGIYLVKYIPFQQQHISLKIGIISAPPSFSFIQEDFPNAFMQYSIKEGFKGIINELNLLNVLLGITVILIMSFIQSGYLGILNRHENEPARIKDFFIEGNRLWYKFFIFKIITIIPPLLIWVDRSLVFLMLLNVLFLYVPYTIVVENKRMVDNFVGGMAFLLENLWMSIKMAFVFGFCVSLIAFFVYFINDFGLSKLIIGFPLVGYCGVAINKAVLEIYRELSNNPQEEVIQQ